MAAPRTTSIRSVAVGMPATTMLLVLLLCALFVHHQVQAFSVASIQKQQGRRRRCAAQVYLAAASASPQDEQDSLLFARSLQQRLDRYQSEQRQEQGRIQDNFATSNWSVRGFALDPEQPLDITTFCLVVDNDNDNDSESLALVGRSNGSLCLIRLGQEVVAKFTNQWQAVSIDIDDNDNDLVSAQERLARDESTTEMYGIRQDAVPFEILGQVQGNGGDDSAIFFLQQIPSADKQHLLFVVVTQARPTTLQLMTISYEADADPTHVPMTFSSSIDLGSEFSAGGTAAPIVALECIANESMLLALTSNGLLSAWKLQEPQDNSLLDLALWGQLSFPVEYGEPDIQVTCLTTIASDTEEEPTLILVGTSLGRILVYSLPDNIMKHGNDDVAANPSALYPDTVIASNSEGLPVTAMAVAGGNTMSFAAPNTIPLVVGIQDGRVVQFHLFRHPSSSRLVWYPRVGGGRSAASTLARSGMGLHVLADGPAHPVTSLAFVPGGGRGRSGSWVAGCSSTNVYIWDLAASKKQQKADSQKNNYNDDWDMDQGHQGHALLHIPDMDQASTVAATASMVLVNGRREWMTVLDFDQVASLEDLRANTDSYLESLQAKDTDMPDDEQDDMFQRPFS